MVYSLSPPTPLDGTLLAVFGNWSCDLSEARLMRCRSDPGSLRSFRSREDHEFAGHRGRGIASQVTMFVQQDLRAVLTSGIGAVPVGFLLSLLELSALLR